MKLNDKTLTGVTAVLLAVGVGAAGVILRSEGSDPSPQLPEIAAFTEVAPLELSVVQPQDTGTIHVSTGSEVTAVRKPTGLSLLQSSDKIADLSGLTEIQILPVGGVGVEVELPDLEAPSVDAPSVPVFASVEPAARTEVSPAEDSLPPGIFMDVAANLAALAVPPASEFNSLKIVVSEKVTVASLPNPMVEQSRADTVPSGYTRIPADFCNVEVRATPKSSARVQLRLHAKCHPNSYVTISHAGLQFREKLGEFGQLALTIPAFSEFSVFGIELADGVKASAGAFVSGLSRVERVGISWNGKETTFLHAYEPAIGAGGHVWSLDPRSYAESLLDGGGYMTNLGSRAEGSRGTFAQIFTRPVSHSAPSGIVTLNVETLLDSENCNTSLQIRTAHHSSRSGFSGNRAFLQLPDCNGTSDSLVTKNLVKDLRVAQN